MKKNPLVDFLAAYGPTASSNNIYDEFVSQQAKKTGCTPLEIEQPLIAELYNILIGANPRSVILTGTAGDGKTYVARKILEAISPKESWENTSKKFEITIPNNGRKLTIVKDLSELNKSHKENIFPEIYQTIRNGSPNLFLICVNDGHLLNFFREFESTNKVIYNKITKMLLEGNNTDKEGMFELINMSWQSNENLLKNIFEQITYHTGWKDCEGCPFMESNQSPCPIRLNLNIMKQDGHNSFKNRLQELVNLAAYDGNHLSIRQLILLTVNILLGDQRNAGITNNELLNCNKAKKRAEKSEYDYTNPYSNVFGKNLSKQVKNNLKVFSTLSGFEVGYETNNFFDHGLIRKRKSFLPDGYYSRSIFEKDLQNYLENPRKFSKKFSHAIIAQRQRLFFSENINETHGYKGNPWNLSKYKSGANYLKLLSGNDQNEREFRKFKSDLFKGLNRMMTGELTDTSNEIWMIAPSAVFAGQGSSLLIDRIGSNRYGQLLLHILPSDGYGRPLVIRVAIEQDHSKRVDLEITPTFFEYLLRISEGALPASFPVDFQQAIQRFQIKVMSLNREFNLGGNLSSQVKLTGGDLIDKQIRVLM